VERTISKAITLTATKYSIVRIELYPKAPSGMLALELLSETGVIVETRAVQLGKETIEALFADPDLQEIFDGEIQKALAPKVEEPEEAVESEEEPA
jgi:hypothetical protein